MDLVAYLQQSHKEDATWDTAREYVTKCLPINTTIGRLIRGGWFGQFDDVESMRLIGASKINVGCLLEAAQIKSDGRKPDITYIKSALNTLGLGYSSIVIAVNITTRLTLKTKPPPLWKALFKEMMSAIEVGYKFGSKVPEIGSAGGALMGFAGYAGLAVLLMAKKKAFREWRTQTKTHGHVGRRVELELFGCEAYQVAGLALQHFGFGTEAALGAAIAAGRLDPKMLSLERGVVRWKATFDWIEALRAGRDYPADPELRQFFPEIAPPAERNERNPLLGMLYTEVAGVKSRGSDWTWHLPFPDYKTTEEKWGLDV